MPRSSPLLLLGSFLILAAAFLLGFSSCGGGGGGSGSGSTGAGSAGITLESISFPAYTDLSGATTAPPSSAPLSQQVVLTFSGPVKGSVSKGAVLISAMPGLDYQGPEKALDTTQSLIPARGTFEVRSNLVVFTPFIPTGEIDLSVNARAENVPGLLPGYTYTVFVPVGTGGSVENLKGIKKGIDHPVEFTTVSEDLPSLFFRNQPMVPPRVTATEPLNGAIDFPINFFSSEASEAIVLLFDQPLDFRNDNLEGVDRDGDGVREQNIFLCYTGYDLYTAGALDSGAGYAARMNAKEGTFDALGLTYFNGASVVLNSLAFTKTHKLKGCSGDAIYDVDVSNITEAPSLPDEGILPGGGLVKILNLANRKVLSPAGLGAKALCITAEQELYALTVAGTSLLRINAVNGALEELGDLASGLGDFVDLAIGPDNELYGLRVYSPGTASALCSVERIDRDTLTCTPLFSGLQGDLVSMSFQRPGLLTAFDFSSNRVVHVDLASGSVLSEAAIPVDTTDLGGEITGVMGFDLKRFELGGTPRLQENSYQGARVRLVPSGILPMDAWVDIMVRFSLMNVSEGSMHGNHGYRELGAESVCAFRTADPGAGEVLDYILEDFLDNEREEPVHDFANARAIWNVQDMDEAPPYYSHLLAGLGLTGGGELGDFLPKGVSARLILDTNYQAFPLFDGSTPNIFKSTVVKNGEFHFRDIIIPEGVTVTAQGENPLVFTATGRVEIAGIIDVSGRMGGVDTTFNSAFIPTPGGPGGAGGGRGGMGQPPIPQNFSALTQLQAPPFGERGWGPGNKSQTGGQGGESGANLKTVPWRGSARDEDSRGAGAGGGSFLQAGTVGYPGKGKFGIDDKGVYYVREHSGPTGTVLTSIIRSGTAPIPYRRRGRSTSLKRNTPSGRARRSSLQGRRSRERLHRHQRGAQHPPGRPGRRRRRIQARLLEPRDRSAGAAPESSGLPERF